AGDWNDDGTDDIGTYKQGVWQLYVFNGTTYDPPIPFNFNPTGSTSAKPVVGDWDGDGDDDFGVYLSGTWHLKSSVHANA
ncbi:MAG: hypothetical protein HC767_15750, partial [Akkermansiaceae bacterium]|nr:hypothetical protein [Akkermansiaceae bacterium]